jgi:hypothetical protein
MFLKSPRTKVPCWLYFQRAFSCWHPQLTTLLVLRMYMLGCYRSWQSNLSQKEIMCFLRPCSRRRSTSCVDSADLPAEAMLLKFFADLLLKKKSLLTKVLSRCCWHPHQLITRGKDEEEEKLILSSFVFLAFMLFLFFFWTNGHRVCIFHWYRGDIQAGMRLVIFHEWGARYDEPDDQGRKIPRLFLLLSRFSRIQRVLLDVLELLRRMALFYTAYHVKDAGIHTDTYIYI